MNSNFLTPISIQPDVTADPDYYEKLDRFLRLGDWVDFKESQPLVL